METQPAKQSTDTLYDIGKAPFALMMPVCLMIANLGLRSHCWSRPGRVNVVDLPGSMGLQNQAY